MADRYTVEVPDDGSVGDAKDPGYGVNGQGPDLSQKAIDARMAEREARGEKPLLPLPVNPDRD